MKNGNSWQADTRRLLSFRLKKLLIGDALISYRDRWRVDCSVENSSEAIYIVTCNGEELVRRKRLESVLDFLVDNNAPDTLEFVSGGAAHLLETGNLDGLDLLGFYPGYDAKMRSNYDQRSYEEAKGWMKFNYFNFRLPTIPEIIRIIVQDKQSSWSGRTLRLA